MEAIKLGLYGLGGLVLLASAFLAGRLSTATPTSLHVTPTASSAIQSFNTQFNQNPSPNFGLPPQTPQAAPDPREMIPLPGPGNQQPGTQPGQQNGSAQCPVFIYQDGQLYALPQPGQQPGQGQGQGPGIPGGGSPELIPLQPLPGLPQPSPLPSPFSRPGGGNRS
ncbi:MAG: hypothetical protein IVW51_01555 [Thermaceae bacterium]|nr:hypothetical protein [Thermaceae bacterium]